MGIFGWVLLGGYVWVGKSGRNVLVGPHARDQALTEAGLACEHQEYDTMPQFNNQL